MEEEDRAPGRRKEESCLKPTEQQAWEKPRYECVVTVYLENWNPRHPILFFWGKLKCQAQKHPCFLFFFLGFGQIFQGHSEKSVPSLRKKIIKDAGE